jgi:acyl-CoA synthetase (AMP-forming)/AMP-acid ligase II
VLNVETHVVRYDMRDVAPGEIGEIVHRSPHLTLGYYKEEDRTDDAFRGCWFHSGDLATIDAEGYIGGTVFNGTDVNLDLSHLRSYCALTRRVLEAASR